MASLQRAQTLWVPLCLQRPVLFSFALLFSALAVALGLTYHTFDQRNGLSAPDTLVRYLWTYVPSSIFILISGSWILVESNLKLLAPWRSMARGPSSASRSVLLDYITPSRLTSLHKIVSNRDWDVMLGVVGSLTLNAIIIFSTGLFRVEEMPLVQSDFKLPLMTVVNSSGTIQQSGNGLASAYAISRYGLQQPKGTTKSFAYQSVNITGVPRKATARFEVDAFYPETSCEVASAEWKFGVVFDSLTGVNGSAGARISATTTDCTMDYMRTFDDEVEEETFLLDLGLANCTKASGTQFEPRFTIITGSMSGLNTNLTSAELNFTNGELQSVDPSEPSYFRPLETKISQSSAAVVFCSITPRWLKASLSIASGQVTAKLAKYDTKRPATNSTHERQLQTAIIQALMLDSMYLTGMDPHKMHSGPDKSVDRYSSRFAAFFQLMNDTIPQASVDTVVDPAFLIKTAPRTIELISAQMAANYLFMHADEEVTVALSTTEDRLTVPSIAFGMVVCLLGLMCLISLALCIQPKAVLYKNPATIAAMATILALNSIVTAGAANVAHSAEGTKQWFEHMGSFALSSPNPNDVQRISIKVVPSSETRRCCKEIENPCEVDIKWWSPWSTSTSCKAVALILPFGLIATLEYLYRRSLKMSGVVEVSQNEYVQYAWVYVPVAVVFGVKTIFELISCTNRIIEPYVKMHQSSETAPKSIHLDLVHRLTASAMIKGFRLGLYGTATAILATFLGAGLPIATSGLFRTHTPIVKNDVSLQQTSAFNADMGLSFGNITQDYLPTPAFILFNNLSYPQWTHGKYALPRLETATDDQASSKTLDGNQSVRVEVPAVFGVANCSMVSPERITISTGPADAYTQALGKLIVDNEPAEGCGRLSFRSDILAEEFYIANWESTQTIFRMNYSGEILRNDTSKNTHAASYHGQYLIPAHCPLSAMILVKGKYLVAPDNTSSVDIEDFKYLHCTPYVEQEIVEVNLTLPNFDIAPSSPPIPKSNTRSLFSEAEILNTGFWSYYLPTYRAMKLDPAVPNIDVDPFFRAVFGGTGGVIASEVIKNDAEMTGKLLQRVEDVYGLIVAQVYGTRRRFGVNTGVSASGTPTSWPAVLFSSSQPRLKQDEISTRILQGLLGAMALCAIVSTSFTQGHKVLPQNPCSIAAIAAYLSGSSLLAKENIPEGSEIMNSKIMRENGILQHGLFSFGWWGEGHLRRYGIDMGKAEESG